MRLIKPSFEIIDQLPGEVGLLKHIETCGRVAWKSEDRTSDDSYLKFIEMLKSWYCVFTNTNNSRYNK